MRERLIELINAANTKCANIDCADDECCEYETHRRIRSGDHPKMNCRDLLIVDYLLENGVLCPPCKIGDDLYWINDETNEVEKQEKGITGITLCPKSTYRIINNGLKVRESNGKVH